MKKIIAVGDTHGRRYWEQLKRYQFDRMIFIGDYFDSEKPIPYQTQIENFNNIVEFKRENPDKVVLLIGNHDYHYIEPLEEYSGYQHYGTQNIKEAITDALDVLQVAHLEEDGIEMYLFTHAGLTKTWCELRKIDQCNLVENVNRLFIEDQSDFCFYGFNGYGDDITQGPLWVRPNSLELDSVEGYTQVVGHTNYSVITDKGNYIYIDSPEEYLFINDGNRQVKQFYLR